MTSETDYPRQRTVAELLAEHGGGAPTGRRRRRRAAEDPDPGAESMAAAPVATDLAPVEPDWAESPPEPDRSVLREPVPNDPGVGVASLWDTPATNGHPGPAPEPEPGPVPTADPPSFRSSALPPARPPRLDPPTEQIPLISGEPPVRELALGGPMERLRRASPKWRDALDVVERTEREPYRDRPAPAVEFDDGGPPTQAGALDLDDGGPPTQASTALEPDDLEEIDESRYGLGNRAVAPDRYAPDRYADEGYADDVDWDDEDEDEEQARRVDGPAADEIDLQPRRRLGRAAAESVSTGPAWALVLAQWIAGALAGAVLWVGFRFLWRNLPVVALTAAALVTLGLIVLVRALLRSKDWRTTGLAVLVGLLLTVSPALLVLLDR